MPQPPNPDQGDARTTSGAPSTLSNATLIRHLLADRSMPCPTCGYQLRGIGSDRCPECGSQLHIMIKGRGRVWLAWSLAMLAFLVAAALCVPEVYDNWVRNIKYPWRRYQHSGQIDIPFGAEHAIFIASMLGITLLITFRKWLFRRRPRIRWGVTTFGTLASLLAVIVVFEFHLFAQPRLYGVSRSVRETLEKYLAECGALQHSGVREIVSVSEGEWDITVVRRYIDADGALVFERWRSPYSSTQPEWRTSTFRTTDPGAIALFNALYRSDAFETSATPYRSTGGGYLIGYHVRSGSKGAHDAIGFHENENHELYTPIDLDTYLQQHMTLKSLQQPEVAWYYAAHWMWGEHMFSFMDQDNRENPPVFGESEFLPLEPSRLGLLLPYGPIESFHAALDSLDSAAYLVKQIEQANASMREGVRQVEEDLAQRESIQAWIKLHATPETPPGTNP